jgi:hypothetical protein
VRRRAESCGESGGDLDSAAFRGVGVAETASRLRRRGRGSELGTRYESWERDNRRSGARWEVGDPALVCEMEAGNPALGSHVVDAAGIGNLGSGTDYYSVPRV